MSGNYRAKWHDYSAKSIYHITLLKSPEMPAFGSLAGDWQIPAGAPGSPYIASSPLGKAVKETLRELPLIHPALKLYSYALMPDHLHLLIRVEANLDEILGRKIGRFKDRVNKRVGAIGVFAPGFNDQILTASRSLDLIFNYIRSNPYRLAVRKANPDFFRRINNLTLGNTPCQAYGNIHLLDNPFKDQVIVHRADSAESFANMKEHWLYTAANGGVLVSPFISPREKEVREEAERNNGRFILITNAPLAERQKPAGRNFDLCAQGRLLIIAPMTAMALNRGCCLKMNSMAKELAAAKPR